MFGNGNTLFSAAARAVLALWAAWILLGRDAAAEQAREPVKVGVLAKRGRERCLEKWGPTAQYLTKTLPGYSFTIVPLDFDEVEPAVERGEVDFVLANPAFYVGFEQLHGANRIATLKNRILDEMYVVYGAVIFHRAGRNDIHSLGDLKGKTVMAVHTRSFGGWLAAWRELKEHGIDPYRDFRELEFGGTHDAVVYAVRDGKVDVGIVRTDTLEQMEREGKIRLDDFCSLTYDHAGKRPCYFPFLHTTDVYPEWPFAKLKHTDEELAKKAAIALIKMPADCEAAKAAQCAGWTVPLNYQPVHECLKAVRIRPYEDYSKVTFGAMIRQHWLLFLSALALVLLSVAFAAHAARLNTELREAVAAGRSELIERKAAEEGLRKQRDHLAELERDRHEMEKLAATGRMAVGIAHEINNPLAGLKNSFLVLKDAIPPDHEDYEFVDLILGEIERISNIVRQMYQLYNPDSDKPAALDIASQLEEVCQMLDPKIRQRQLRLQTDLIPVLPKPVLPMGHFRQILYNLLVNAIDASPAEGELRLTVATQGDTVRISVTDQGEGIPCEILPHIFEPFFTTKNKNGSTGMGLGLSVSQSLAVSMGGRITVDTEVGKGSTFTLVLPYEGGDCHD